MDHHQRHNLTTQWYRYRFKRNIFIADSWNHRIRKIDPSGDVSTFAGNGSRRLSGWYWNQASFLLQTDIAIDQTDHLYVADRFNDKIRKITPDGVVTTLANSDASGTLVGIEVDHSGNIYVASDDPGRESVLGRSSTQLSPIGPEGIVVDEQSNIYLSVYENKIIQDRFIGEETLYAGTGSSVQTNDGGGTAEFNRPIDITLDSFGNFMLQITTQI